MARTTRKTTRTKAGRTAATKKSSKSGQKKSSKAARQTKSSARKSAAKRPVAKSRTSPAAKAGKSLKPGDKVAWDSPQGRTTGHVVKKQTKPTRIKTHKVAASKSDPEYIVESDKSGKRAAHKPSELRKA